ncbi:MAG: MGH1-like glycoside hydrolase domain-containing protein, partial [Terriglobales bacterium]
FEHFIYIGSAMKKMGGRDYQLWDEKDGFFYDVLRYPSGEFHKFRLRSLVGLIPLYAIEVLRAEDLEPFPAFKNDVEWFLSNRADLVGDACYRDNRDGERYILSIAAPDQFARLLRRLSDPSEFLSPYGLRSISKYHEHHPFEFAGRSVGYEPGEAEIKLKGGNSNWRGPIWFPTSYLLIHSLLRFGQALRDEPDITGEGGTTTPSGFAQEVGNRMIAIFTRDKSGHRASAGEYTAMQQDPLWRDLILFHEYYHGDTGKGLGASHQTGWSGLIANLIDEWRR